MDSESDVLLATIKMLQDRLKWADPDVRTVEGVLIDLLDAIELYLTKEIPNG